MSSQAHIAKEEALLLSAAARTASPFEPLPDHEESRRARILIGGGFDWRRFLRLSQLQRCAPAAHHYLCALGFADAPPPEVFARLCEERDLARALYLRNLSDLGQLKRILENRGVSAVVLKGIPLAHRLYTDPSLRVSRDIDLLCRQEDLQPAEDALSAAGYSRFKWRLSRGEYREHHFHFIYVRGEANHRAVEIHWNLRPPAKGALLDMEPLRERARVVEIGGENYAVLDPVDTLWHLGLSLASEDALDLRDLADLRRLALGMREEDWSFLAAICRQSGTTHELSIALALSERAFQSFVPRGARRSFRPSAASRALFLPSYSMEGIARRSTLFPGTQPIAACFFLRSGARRKIAFLARILFPDRASAIETRDAAELPHGRAELVRFHAAGVWILAKLLLAIAFSALLSKAKPRKTRAVGIGLDRQDATTGVHHI